jgi:hypothetical protein
MRASYRADHRRPDDDPPVPDARIRPAHHLTACPTAQSGVRDPHLRSVEVDLFDDLDIGVRLSPTFRHLVARLEESDVVVYLMFDRSLTPSMAGHVSVMSAVGGRRYLRISIDRRTAGCQRLAILGHELQHAVEIAEAADAADQNTMAALYRRIGFRSANGRQDSFDSPLAIETGQQVRRETLAASAAGNR